MTSVGTLGADFSAAVDVGKHGEVWRSYFALSNDAQAFLWKDGSHHDARQPRRSDDVRERNEFARSGRRRQPTDRGDWTGVHLGARPHDCASDAERRIEFRR